MGLRERKRERVRALLSTTATELFLERGFDGVRVADVAAACEVSEATVYNHFPTKEQLLLDRFPAIEEGLRSRLAEPVTSPMQAMLATLDAEVAALDAWIAGQPDRALARSRAARFGELLETTPALRAHRHLRLDEIRSLVADVIAQRVGGAPSDPEPQMIAGAVVALATLYGQSVRRRLSEDGPLASRVREDLERGAAVTSVGIS